MKRILSLITLLVVILSVNSFAYYKTLNDSLVSSAISKGRQIVNDEKAFDRFSNEYTQRATCCGKDRSTVFIVTPYCMAVSVSYEAIRAYEEPSISILKEVANESIRFDVVVFGDRIDFIKGTKSVILIGQGKDTLLVRPYDVDIPAMEIPEVDLDATKACLSPRYMAYLWFYYKPAMVANDVVTLVVILPHTKIYFEMDLRKLK